jgi:riboflavin synthase
VTDRTFSVAVIPHTAAVTTLGLKQVDDPVNLESDLIGKFVERLLQQRSQLPKSTPVIDKDYLQKRGLI